MWTGHPVLRHHQIVASLDQRAFGACNGPTKALEKH
ncbi:MAG: hypothetical protein ACJA00_004508, partial [Myxococcota bacterium]